MTHETARPVVRDFRPKRPVTSPSAVSELPPEDDRRLLRLSLAVAALVHLGLLFLPMPWTGAAAAPEPPPEVTGCRVITLRAPPPPPTDTTPPPVQPATPIPVPEWLVEEPPADDAPSPLPTPEVPADVPVIYLDPPPPPPAPPAPPAPPEDGPIYVVGAVEPPVAIDAPRPVYPEIARQARRGGLVIVQVVVEKDGRVTDVEVLKPEPFGLTEAAVDAVERWRFEPARLDGEPVAVYFQLTVRFTLQ